MMNSARTLLTTLIDYAGLFPPAQLQMRAAVPRYAAHRAGPHAWMVGRYVLPLAQLEEFEHVFDELPATDRAVPWPLGVLGGKSLEADVRKMIDFNRRHGDDGRQDARIEAIDLKVHSLDDIARAADVVAEAVDVYFEIPINTDPRDRLAAVAEAGGRAKVRTGGVSEDMFPPVADLARFLLACAAARVAFKATAGLHYPVRSEHPVTSEANAPKVVMHGFLNVFVAAALSFADRAGLDVLEGVLAEQSPSAFVFDKTGISVHGCRLTCDQLLHARQRFALSFGSCSLEQPTEALGMIGVI